MRTITIGVDLAKQVFSVCSVDAAGRVEDWWDLRREALRRWLPNVAARTMGAVYTLARTSGRASNKTVYNQRRSLRDGNAV